MIAPVRTEQLVWIDILIVRQKSGHPEMLSGVR